MKGKVWWYDSTSSYSSNLVTITYGLSATDAGSDDLSGMPVDNFGAGISLIDKSINDCDSDTSKLRCQF